MISNFRNIWAIPDVHGRKDLLEEILWELPTNHELDLTVDLLVFMGDYIDRGPDSKGVLNIIMQLYNRYPEHVVALRGNHEDMCIDACVKNTNDDFYLWTINGGEQTLYSFLPHSTVPQNYLEWLTKLPYQFETDKFFFSHAPVPKEHNRLVYLRDQPYTSEELTWSRPLHGETEEQHAKDFKTKVGVCGHNHALHKNIMEPRLYKHYIYADAGCGCHPKAPLVAIEVQSRKIVYAWPGVKNET